MNLLRAFDTLVLAGLDLVIAICTERPMEPPKSASQRALESDIEAFLAHASRHGGPEERCVNCQRFRELIRNNDQTLVDTRTT